MTLVVRLVANLSVGHVVCGLLRLCIVKFPTVTIICVFYTVFEMGVAVVQAYIFRLLLTLYLTSYR